MPRITPWADLVTEIPLPLFFKKTLFSIWGFPVPVTKIPSLTLLINVLFLITGLLDSTHTAVPREFGLVKVKPVIIVLLFANSVISCLAKVRLV